jgi:hypothetical protein
MDDTDLRARLESLASRTAPPVQDADELVAIVAERSRAGRRRQALLVAAAAAVVAVLVAVPAVRSDLGRDTDPASPAPSTGIYTPPTRGSYADEDSFVEGVRRLPWTSEPAGDDVPEPPLDTRHVVFAGMVADERWVLVAGADPGRPLPPDEDGNGRRELDGVDRVAIAWFTGPLHAAPEEMTLFSTPRVVPASEPTALHDSAGGAIVVAAPGDTVEVSELVEMEPDGTLRRDYEKVPDLDGVAILELRPVATSELSLRYRLTREGDRLTRPFDSYPNPDFTLPDIRFDHVRAAPPPAPGDQAAAAAIDDLFGRTGVSAEYVRSFTVLWAGDLAGPDGQPVRLTVLAVELPDGPYYVTGALGGNAPGQRTTSSCGSEIRPSSTRLDRSTVVLRCLSSGGLGSETGTLVVVATPGATAARVLDDRGEKIASYPLTDGVAVVPFPTDLASVAVVDAAGRTVDERPPMGVADFGD